MEGEKYAANPINVSTLKRLVEANATVREIAARFGVSASTARKHLRRHGLRTARSDGNGRRKGIVESGRHTTRACLRHGTTRFVLDAQGYYRCMKCRADAVARRRHRVKEILVREAGGACQLCGYDRHLGALHFHHRDPAAKHFGVSHGGFTKALAKLREEAGKCALLCSNCHAEVEAGLVALYHK